MSIIFENDDDISSLGRLPPLRRPQRPLTVDRSADQLWSRRKAAHLAPIVGPPTNRQELMQFLSVPPPDPLPAFHLIHLRSHIVRLGFLDDAGPVALLAGFAAHARDPKFAVRFLQQALKVMVRAGKGPSTIAQAFEGPVVKLAKREDWDAVLVLTSAVVRRAGFRTERLVGCRVRALYAKGRVAEVPGEVERLSSPSGDRFDDLIGAHLAMGHIADAQEALAQKQRAGHPTTVRTALALLEGNWSLNGNLLMEEKLLEQCTRTQLVQRQALRQDAQVLNKMLAARTQRGDCARALEVMDHFDLSGAPPLALPYADAPPASAKRVKQGQELAHAASKGYWRPRPDARTFVILSSLAIRQGRADCAVVLVAQAIHAGVECTPKLIAALIRALAAYGKISRAEDLLFSIARGDTRVQVARLGVKIWVLKTIPAAAALEAVLAGALKTGGLVGGREFLQRVTKAQGRPPRLTPGLVNTLVDYLTKTEATSSPARVASLLYKFRKLASSRKRPTVRNLNGLLAAQLHRERFAKPTRASRYRKRMQAHSASAERDAAHNVALPLTGPPSPLTRVRQSLTHSEVPTHLPNTSSRILRIQRNGLSPEEMWSYIEHELLEKELHPTRHHLAVILSAHIREGDPQGALTSLQRGFKCGVDQHVALYSVLIGGLARLGKFALARESYVQMKLAGLKPDRRLYAALALAASRRRDMAGFNAVLEEAERELPLSERLRAPLRLDPIFVAIQYRTLVSSRRVFDALQLVQYRLRQGLVPDRALQLAVRRTRGWMRWKLNVLERTGRASRQTIVAAVGSAELDKVARIAMLVDIRLRRMLRNQVEKDRQVELDRIVGLWGEKAVEVEGVALIESNGERDGRGRRRAHRGRS